MSFESANNVWGYAKNPWNHNRIVGGSSGGEGGLLSTRCSPIGIGSDIGGSLRSPPAFCGIYGFRPSSNRVSSS